MRVPKMLPIGIQSFEDLRENNCLYVDKTESIYHLIRDGKFYFISRPRRFGKSLLISTLKAIFEGKKELFNGLKISDTKYEWITFPVLHFDMTMPSEKTLKALKESIEEIIESTARKFSLKIDKRKSLDVKLSQFFEQAKEKYGKVVILVDEYDNPIHTLLENDQKIEEMQDFLNGFYSNFKKHSQHIRFCFITGVTQFGKLTIFSGLNHLNDISLDENYCSMLGYIPLLPIIESNFTSF